MIKFEGILYTVVNEEKQMQRLAVRLFLSVGFAVTLILFGVLSFFVGVFFLGSRSVTTQQYRDAAIWWMLAGILMFVAGFPLLIKFLKDSPPPGTYPQY